MITTCFLVVSLIQIDSEYWPPGYFDIVGEMTYKEAADAIGAKPPKSVTYSNLTMEIKKEPTNVILWKAAADMCTIESRWAEFYQLCNDSTGPQSGLQNKSSWQISNAIGYSLLAIKSHFVDRYKRNINKDLITKWERLLELRAGIIGGTRKNKSEILVQLASQRGSPTFWRDLIDKYEGKVGCNYYLNYSRAESYMFGEIPTDEKGKPIASAIPIDIPKCTLAFRKTNQLFPAKATPYYKLASLLWEKDREAARVYAKKYLSVENRSFKSRWMKKMQEFAK